MLARHGISASLGSLVTFRQHELQSRMHRGVFASSCRRQVCRRAPPAQPPALVTASEPTWDCVIEVMKTRKPHLIGQSCSSCLLLQNCSFSPEFLFVAVKLLAAHSVCRTSDDEFTYESDVIVCCFTELLDRYMVIISWVCISIVCFNTLQKDIIQCLQYKVQSAFLITLKPYKHTLTLLN